MALVIKYFNSFVLKKNVNADSDGANNSFRKPVWPGLPSDPAGYPVFPTSSPSSGTPVGRTQNTGSTISVGGRNWIIEEARIRGGFNNAEVGYGVRAYLREDSNQQSIRDNALIYSGIFNSRTDVNQTNVFSVAEDITKAVDPFYGSIQKIHALDSNLAILQENKVSRALIDKDAIYSAEGGGTLTSANVVIGQITPYVGDYGISRNPESFATYGYRRYFTDVFRNSVMRLSNDGLTEISQYGMSDFFRDQFNELDFNYKPKSFSISMDSSGTNPGKIRVSGNYIDEIEKGAQVSIPQTSGAPIQAKVNGMLGISATLADVFLNINPGSIDTNEDATFTKFVVDRIPGGYDVYNENYVVSMQNRSTDINVEDTYQTTAFEDVPLNGWVSRYSYDPSFMTSIKGDFFTTKGGNLYVHYVPDDVSPSNRCNFYNTRTNAFIQFIFNPSPSVSKNFKTISYEGSNGWQVDSFVSDKEEVVNNTSYEDEIKVVRSNEEGKYTEDGVTYNIGFVRKENKYYSNLRSNNEIRPGQVVIEDYGENVAGIKGYFATVKVSTDNTTDVGGTKELFAVSSEFVVSAY